MPPHAGTAVLRGWNKQRDGSAQQEGHHSVFTGYSVKDINDRTKTLIRANYYPRAALITRLV